MAVSIVEFSRFETVSRVPSNIDTLLSQLTVTFTFNMPCPVFYCLSQVSFVYY